MNFVAIPAMFEGSIVVSKYSFDDYMIDIF